MYADTGVVIGQTYYYRLTWDGTTCGGQGGQYSQNAVAQAPALRGHVTWQGRGSQPDVRQQWPLTMTLALAGNVYTYTNMTTDASGYFTASVATRTSGTYQYWVKGPQYLANSGTVTLNGATVTSSEMGNMLVGDANEDNVIDVIDYSVLRSTFGRSVGDPNYDARADFNDDGTVDVTDYSLLRANFGSSGALPLAGAGSAPGAGSPDQPTPVPASGGAYLELRPKGNTPQSNGQLKVGDKITLELWVNSGLHDDLIGQQTYLTFTNQLLQNTTSNITANCAITNTIVPSTEIFTQPLQNQVCNGPLPCTSKDKKLPVGTIAFASVVSPESPNLGSVVFKVGEINFCAIAPGPARIAWQFSSSEWPYAITKIADATGLNVSNPDQFTNYTFTISK
jgi:hypothetical protein